ncbi:selenium cofactor biosynthesis protein YqeC [Romboutsia sp.]|uniref:selenium cofactor biosynthesis protein YqeC n=1 Tax=Romboutsia sp. TaxID=1965302 RepID=UPI002C48AF42|nr:selenium cofactor biosynthesis protein YqeC [Romboutsia sp.]HSQ90336.1 selenium cofactor biosynthesis protein YqeC [Romboutsia sp.]
MDVNNLDKLENMIKLGPKEIISVVGAGGKTSFINYIANKYKDKMRVLITATTKIYVPSKNIYNNIHMLDEDKKIIISKDLGITVIGKYINKEKKIVGLDFKELEHLIPKFDLILIEGDGSKRKKLKGWNNKEPIVYPKSTKTIGILDITSYNMEINDKNIHRLEELRKITNINNTKVDINNLVDIVLNKNGLFKNACGQEILLINRIKSNHDKNIAKQLICEINKYKNDLTIICNTEKL